MSLALILLALAFASFALAAFNVPIGSVNLVALGLALWVLTFLLPASTALVLLIVVLLLILVLVKLLLERRT